MAEEKNNNDADSKKSVNDIVPEKDTTEAPAQEGSDNKNKWLMVGAIGLVLVLIGGALYFGGYMSFLDGNSTDREVLATVNGEEITRADLNARMLQNQSTYESQGADLSDPEVQGELESQELDFLVNEELILQDAESMGISASDEEVEAQFQQTMNNFPDEQAFENALDENGLSRQTLRENITKQLVVQKYFEEAIDEEATAVTEEEITEFYSEYQAQNPEAPALEELRPQIENLLSDQKAQAEVESILVSLKEQADIQIML